MRFLFVGAVESSSVLLRAAIATGANIAAVATLPPAIGRKRHADYCDLASIAASASIPLRHTENDVQLAAAVAEFRPDVLLVWGWSRIVPKDILDQARFGGIGFHPAPLPNGRGRHPLIWTILLGLQASAVCFFRLGENADDGEILQRRDFAIPADISARGLMDLIVREGALAVPDLLAGLRERGDLSGMAQGEPLTPAWRKRGEADGRIDFRMSASAVERLVRALGRPYPGAVAVHASLGSAKIWRAKPLPMQPEWRYAEPGRVVLSGLLDSEAGPVVRCDDGAVCLLEHEFSHPIEVGSWFC